MRRDTRARTGRVVRNVVSASDDTSWLTSMTESLAKPLQVVTAAQVWPCYYCSDEIAERTSMFWRVTADGTTERWHIECDPEYQRRQAVRCDICGRGPRADEKIVKSILASSWCPDCERAAAKDRQCVENADFDALEAADITEDRHLRSLEGE